MTKLEELTALLVNEINDFNKGIEKLEKITSQLKDTKIRMDLSEYKSIIESHKQEMETHLNALKSFENRFEKQLKHAKIYPTWAVVVFIVSLLFGFISVTYLLLK
jgi:chromosome segregation ATPase